jgi:hypothetical protein
MTQLWFETQNKWIFLRSALVNLNGINDDQTYLKPIYLKFTDIDENFRVIYFHFFNTIFILFFLIEFSKISISKSICCWFS